jgi:hypothetical protein
MDYAHDHPVDSTVVARRERLSWVAQMHSELADERVFLFVLT